MFREIGIVGVLEMTIRQMREYKRMCAREGFALLGIARGGKHCRLQFEVGFVTAPTTPSDNRNMMNVRGEIRRLHR